MINPALPLSFVFLGYVSWRAGKYFIRTQGRAVAAHQAHNLEVAGSIPAPATNFAGKSGWLRHPAIGRSKRAERIHGRPHVEQVVTHRRPTIFHHQLQQLLWNQPR